MHSIGMHDCAERLIILNQYFKIYSIYVYNTYISFYFRRKYFDPLTWKTINQHLRVFINIE